MAKNGKLPNWEVSYQRFSAGEHPQAIAMSQESGKPIQAATVVGHIMEAVLHARPVDLRRLVETSGVLLPNEHEWMRIEEAVGALGIDVIKTSQVPSKDIMLAAAGRVDKPQDEKSAEDRQIEGAWYERVRWYLHLKRAGVAVSFSNGSDGDAPPTKRQRT